MLEQFLCIWVLLALQFVLVVPICSTFVIWHNCVRDTAESSWSHLCVRWRRLAWSATCRAAAAAAGGDDDATDRRQSRHADAFDDSESSLWTTRIRDWRIHGGSTKVSPYSFLNKSYHNVPLKPIVLPRDVMLAQYMLW